MYFLYPSYFSSGRLTRQRERERKRMLEGLMKLQTDARVDNFGAIGWTCVCWYSPTNNLGVWRPAWRNWRRLSLTPRVKVHCRTSGRLDGTADLQSSPPLLITDTVCFVRFVTSLKSARGLRADLSNLSV